jgi:hypothetical protein
MVVLRFAGVCALMLLVGLARALAGDPSPTPPPTTPAPAPAPAGPPSVFDLPMLKAVHVVTEGAVAELFARGEYEKAAKLLEQAVQRIPQDFNAHYNLACALARLGKTEEAMVHLQKAVELGFRDAKHVEGDEDLANLRNDPRFVALLKKAAEPLTVRPEGWKYRVEPAVAKDGQVVVGETNTAWDGRFNIFRSLLKIDKEATAAKPIAEGYGKAGDLLRQWAKEGTAAGNAGDLYDNHDSGHSRMNFKTFPQLTCITFSPEAQKRQLHHGLQRFFFYNGVCIGNSSTALTSGPLWRCQGRLAVTQPGVPLLLYLQYVGNHLYLYPVHVDNNPGHNGAGGKGYGDCLPANMPYLILSQGSSGSDIVFLDTLAATLAAFRPEVKRELIASGTLMPALQMIFRTSNRVLAKPEDYLTGKAHPTAFQGSQVDAEKMVTLAHAITSEVLPPMVRIKVLEEDQAVLGRDYFDVGPRERLFDTPCAVARIVKSTKYERRMVVSAEGSKDLHGKPLQFHWVVLRGDENKIHIRKLNAEGSQAELLVGYHERRPIAPGSPRESNRVDIGVFVHNGVYFSAPAFICFYTLDNEKRVYDEKHRIRVVDYTDPAVRDNYVDPLLDFRKDWRDEYRYADDGTLLGWTRIRGEKREGFTAAGQLVLEKDAAGRPAKTSPVRYVSARGPDGVSRLRQEVAAVPPRSEPPAPAKGKTAEKS